MKRIIFLFLLLPFSVFAQIGGANSYNFLDVPVNARVAALGGELVSVRDQDVNLFFQNPAALNDRMAKYFSINFLPYLAGIKATTLAYALPGGKNNTYGIGLTFFDYGRMEETTPGGDVIGTFRVNEYAVTGSVSHIIGNYVIGANLKLAGSHFANYHSFAVLTDLGGMFIHPERDWIIGLTIKNLGYAFDKYTTDTKVNMPFDVVLGTTYKLENMPLRFSLTAHHLHQFDIVFLDPNKKGIKDLQGNEIKEEKKLGDQILRHFNLGGEFILSENFNVRVGYNHMRRRELRTKQKAGLAGFSLGAMIRISSLEFAYTRAFYTFGGASNHIALTTNFSTFLKKRER